MSIRKTVHFYCILQLVKTRDEGDTRYYKAYRIRENILAIPGTDHNALLILDMYKICTDIFYLVHEDKFRFCAARLWM